ncbi:hypothetical protein, partial [Nocardia sp. NPDC051570]|uniref:hypothetical protein n=1 Tax=Nocardia sp. NPDC051570 TaxID=3364324 RepID=UPI00379B179E
MAWREVSERGRTTVFNSIALAVPTCLVLTLAVVGAGPAAAESYVNYLPPQSNPGDIAIGEATPWDMTDMTLAPTGIGPQDYNWIRLWDPAGPGQFITTFDTNGNFGGLPISGRTWTVTSPGGGGVHDWDAFTNRLVVNQAPAMPAYNGNSTFQFYWDAARNGYHYVNHGHNNDSWVDVWYTDTHPGAKIRLNHDGQDMLWASSIAVAKVNGTVKYPGSDPVEIRDWAGEQEREWGPNWTLSDHKVWDYISSGNPDGSEDLMFVFTQNNGTISGLVNHTDADGTRHMCVTRHVEYADWNTMTRPGMTQPFPYPAKVMTGCDDLSYTVTSTGPEGAIQMFLPYVNLVYG